MEKEDIVLAITFAVALALVIWYLFGNSPTLEQVILGIVLLNSGWLYNLNAKFHRHIGEYEGYRKAKAATS